MRRKGENNLAIVLGIFGSIFFIFFLINSFLVNSYYSKKYNIHSASARVTDAGNILRFLPHISTLSVILGLSIFLLHGNSGIIALMAIILMLISLTGMWLLSVRLGTSQIGVLIFKNQDRFIIPADPNKNTLSQNILQLQVVKDLLNMEELPLGGIHKLTKEQGKKVFLHGTFGTRQIAWRNKQKRDECIAAFEMACGKRFSKFDSDW